MRLSIHHSLGFVAVMLAAALAGCSDAGDSAGSNTTTTPAAATRTGGEPALTKLTMQLNWIPEPQFGGFYEAAFKGYFEKHGMQVEVQRGVGGDPTIQMVDSGQVDYAVAEAEQVVFARARGIKVVAVYAAFLTSPRAIMVHKSKGFKSLSEVFDDESMTLGMENGANFGNFLKNKYTFDKIEVVPNAGGMERFLAEKNFALQCFATSEPLVATSRGSDPQVFNIAESGYNPYMTVVVVSEDKLNKNPDEVRKVVAAIREGWASYLKDPASANAKMHEMNDGMNLATFKAAAEAQMPLIVAESGSDADLGKMSLERWSTLIKQLVDLKVLDAGRAPTPAACFTNPSPLASNAPTPATEAATTQPGE